MGIEPASPRQGVGFKLNAEVILVVSCLVPVLLPIGLPLTLYYIRKTEACGVSAGWIKPLAWTITGIAGACLLVFLTLLACGKN
jgi:hypothetical protein